MKDLLTHYSLEEIFLFIVFLALGIKEAIGFFDWANGRLKTKYKNNEEKEQEEKLQQHSQQIEELKNGNKDILKKVEHLTEKIDCLIDSDKDDIKSWITKEHHFFCYTQGFIDDYSLECIERRYSHYVKEGGNSFVESLMSDIRRLPKISSVSNPNVNKNINR